MSKYIAYLGRDERGHGVRTPPEEFASRKGKRKHIDRRASKRTHMWYPLAETGTKSHRVRPRVNFSVKRHFPDSS
jgi:hypothetical protein